MRVIVLQHVGFEGAGALATWAEMRGHSLRSIRVYAGEALPRLEDIDLLVVLGGPMSVHDDAEWLRRERDLIATCVAKDVPVLGICLGAQQLAYALGADIVESPAEEIGWFPVYRVSAKNSPFVGLPDPFWALHWHGESFELPKGAELLASSRGCPRQAFRIGSALGLQFHLEVSEETVFAFVENTPHVGRGRYIQSPRGILEARRGDEANRVLASLLDNWLAGLELRRLGGDVNARDVA